ncbi:hypothetical protein Hanom_Chr16g01515431 [Helianthus anomalus]
MRKNKPLDESRKTGQTSRAKMTFYSISIIDVSLLLGVNSNHNHFIQTLNYDHYDMKSQYSEVNYQYSCIDMIQEPHI